MDTSEITDEENRLRKKQQDGTGKESKDEIEGIRKNRAREKENVIIVAKALDGQRYPCPALVGCV